METQIETLIIKLIEYIDGSMRDPLYSNYTKNEIKKYLQSHLSIIRCKNAIPTNELEMLLTPTGCIQELAIENNWADEYIQISDRIDMIIKTMRN